MTRLITKVLRANEFWVFLVIAVPELHLYGIRFHVLLR